MKDKVNIVTVIAVLTVLGAGALQIGVALATIEQPGIQIAFGVAILCAVVMDAFVIHSMGTEPTNRKQMSVGLVMIGVLLVGLVLDVVLLLTHQSFTNEALGWTRAFVGVNIAFSLVLAAAFFALSETNTHERQMRALEQKSEMHQAKAFHDSKQAQDLYALTASHQFIQRAADRLGVPVSALTKVQAVEPSKPVIIQQPAQDGASLKQQTAPRIAQDEGYMVYLTQDGAGITSWIGVHSTTAYPQEKIEAYTTENSKGFVATVNAPNQEVAKARARELYERNFQSRQP